MNRSGQAVGALARFYKIPVEQVLVLHDESRPPARPGQDRARRGPRRPQRPEGHPGRAGRPPASGASASASAIRARWGWPSRWPTSCCIRRAAKSRARSMPCSTAAAPSCRAARRRVRAGHAPAARRQQALDSQPQTLAAPASYSQPHADSRPRPPDLPARSGRVLALFLRRPAAQAARPARRQRPWPSDWLPGIRPGRVLAWAGLLWAVNLFALGPIAVAAAGLGGAAHRIDSQQHPGHHGGVLGTRGRRAVVPLRPAQAEAGAVALPAGAALVLWGPMGWTAALLACVLLAACLPLRRGRASRARWRIDWRRAYCLRYGVVFHLVALTFAAVHLHNFVLNDTTVWCCPCSCCPSGSPVLVLGLDALHARHWRPLDGPCTRCSTRGRCW